MARRVRRAEPRDVPAWIELRTALWSESPGDHPSEIATYFEERPSRWFCFVAEDDEGAICGFAEAGLRDYAEGCVSRPVAYLEGIYTVPDRRRQGLVAELVAAVEAWARSIGCTELASDAEPDNHASLGFHAALGFEETNRIVCFRKSLLPDRG